VPLEDGALRLENLAPWFLAVLLELPTLLKADQGQAVEERLFPDPTTEPGMRDEWDRLVRPELYALFASAREIVAKDLAGILPEDDQLPFGPWQVTIAAGHVDAWLSALNAARLTLGELHGVTESDMTEEEDDEIADDADEDGEEITWSEKRIAMTKIHLLGWVQHAIIDCHWPFGPTDEEGDDDQPG
jgi:hypothetical protein